MAEVKQVKVDNWGIYFLQRLKHFFNRTDYCDLTLQFQDNAQLKVHRLVLSACTEYFELLERTCEMYEDCLVMPDDLQADVVVPIVNFMYTGQLDFKPEFLEKLYQTSQVMNMPVLTKLLDAHRNQIHIPAPAHDYRNIKSYSKTFDNPKNVNVSAVASTSYMSTKRPYNVAFENNIVQSQSKRQTFDKHFSSRLEKVSNNIHQSSSVEPDLSNVTIKKDSRPSRYELPEELDGENVFDNSFTSISYTSTPLMVHPETVKRYSSKKNTIFDQASSTKRIGTSTVDIVECKKISTKENIFDDDALINISDDMYSKEDQKDANQLFDQILENSDLKPTIKIKDTERSRPKLDHAKIISEVLKKYSHLVKSNKNIKLKILNTPSKSKKLKSNINVFSEEKDSKQKIDTPDFTYETDVLDSKEAAKLIALGAENIKGPWICLICGTPGRALHFTSYYKFRRHLVEVHNEKPMTKICEYCGLKSLKRNYLLHHLYTKHGVEPPPHIHFPKCNYCSYVALTEAYLVKHKMTHIENKNFGCNVCAASFNTSNQLLTHIQRTGHKYSAERKMNLQCIYCLKTFSREANLYAHLKASHKQLAQSDGIIDDSDEEKEEEKLKIGKTNKNKNTSLKYESSSNYDSEYDNLDVQYQIQQRPDGNIHVLTKTVHPSSNFSKHKILNPGFNSTSKLTQNFISAGNISKQETNRDSTLSLINNDNDGIVIIDGAEYIVKDDQLVPRIQNISSEEFLLGNVLSEQDDISLPTTSIEYPTIHNNSNENSKIRMKKTSHIQPVQIVVSNEEEYKALMSANHSIIFEEGDPTKTLTVLTAPQNSALEGSTIDLDKAQSNDMMIIQNNYPLNVTQSATADNSNIVVVYSHPLDDQNKQFQYVTPQSIAAQFIQSSAMITHSYETVTTSTPVMSVNVLNAPVDESWQSNIQHTIEPAPIESQLHSQVADSDLQSIVNPENTANNSQCIKNESILKTHLPAMTTDINNIKEAVAQVSLENTSNILTNSMNQVLITKVDNGPNINVNLTIPSEQLVHKEIQTETIDDNINHIEILGNNLEKENMEKLFDEQQNMQKIEEIDRNINIQTQNQNLQQSTIGEKDNVINDVNVLELPINNMEATVTNLDSEKSKNTEWYEENGQSTPISSASISLNIEPVVDTESSAYVEESIENIQQEMAKQMEAIATESNTIQFSESLITNSDLEIDPTPKEGLEESAIHTYFDVTESTQTIQSNTNIVISKNPQLSCASPVIDTPKESTPIDKKDETNVESNMECSNDNDCIIPDNNPTVLIKDHNDQTESNIFEGAEEISKEMTANNKVEGNTKPSEVNNSKQHTVITLNKTARDKISSLLNDWDENDSQGGDSKNESDLLEDKDSDHMGHHEDEEKDTSQVNESSNDNIKKLVSDWDDDDDDDDESK